MRQGAKQVAAARSDVGRSQLQDTLDRKTKMLEREARSSWGRSRPVRPGVDQGQPMGTVTGRAGVDRDRLIGIDPMQPK